jgi:hypothetical protein
VIFASGFAVLHGDYFLVLEIGIRSGMYRCRSKFQNIDLIDNVFEVLAVTEQADMLFLLGPLEVSEIVQNLA